LDFGQGGMLEVGALEVDVGGGRHCRV
jgi:hypothetical protein